MKYIESTCGAILENSHSTRDIPRANVTYSITYTRQPLVVA